jgi:hypothetical protein
MAEPLNPTFFAFRKRENGVLLGATIAFVIANLLLFVIFGGLLWTLLGGADFLTFYQEVVTAQAQGQAPTATPPNMSGLLLMFPLQIVFMFAIFLLLASYESSALRWMVRGERSGLLNLHFGADMWRVYGTYWAWLLYCIVGFIGFFIAMAAGGLLAASIGDAGGAVLMVVVTVGYMLAWLYVSVRLSPASATSVGIGEFSPLKAWSVSRGRFWSLFGAYLLLFIIYMIFYLLIASLFMGAFYGQILSGLDWSTLQTDPAAFESAYAQASMQAVQNTFSNPASIALYVGGQVALWAFVMVFYLLWFGVESRAVQAALEEGKIKRALAPA